MRLMMLTGAFLGFGIGAAFSWAQRSPWPYVIWRACVAAYLAGALTRWWGRQWINSLRSAHEEKRLSTEKAAMSSTSSK